ncbi:MAG: YraN family protein [Gemmatimonadota bacterium]|nr:YraN family protein [Gemmatimonadota bacterium]
MESTGARGEAIVAAWLERRGIRVVARNWRAGRGEIDLVVRDGRTVAFVEVKTRRLGPGGRPADAVDRRKRRHLVAAAGAWIAGHPGTGGEFRFDVAEVVVAPGGRPLVEHWPDAFRADEA